MLRVASDNDRRLVAESKEFPAPEGDLIMRSVRYENGSIRMAEFHGLGVQPSPPSKSYPTNRGLTLRWQMVMELEADHGISVTTAILDDAGLLLLTPEELEELTGEIKLKAPPEMWSTIGVNLANIEEHGLDREAFIVALWADLFVEPLSDVWLAAMAQHAYNVEDDYFAFGYLTAQLDRRQELESHFLRGKKIVEGGRRGGNARATRMRATSESILREMRRLVAHHGVKRAAALTYNSGRGTSAEANRRLWNRHH